MKKTKKEYVSPEITVTRVEVESALCGSATVANPANNTDGMIQNQQVNTGFTTGLNSNDYTLTPGDDGKYTGMQNGWTPEQ